MKTTMFLILSFICLTVEAREYCFCYGNDDQGYARPMDQSVVFVYEYEFMMDYFSPQGWVRTRSAQLMIPDNQLYKKIRNSYRRNDAICFVGESTGNYYRPQYLVRSLIRPTEEIITRMSCGDPSNIK